MAEHTYFSAEMQDLAALNLLGKAGKTFLDIGAGHPITSNNTFLLEENGWEGICVDTSDKFANEFSHRSSTFHQVDATTDEFIKILSELFPKKCIDYISLDVDAATFPTLENLLRNNFKFTFMTFEHDYHWLLNHRLYNHKEWGCVGRSPAELERCKYKSKDMLQKIGYDLLFENVCFYEKSTGKTLHPWEDWWINPHAYPYEGKVSLQRVESKNIHFRDCIDRIMTLPIVK